MATIPAAKDTASGAQALEACIAALGPEKVFSTLSPEYAKEVSSYWSAAVQDLKPLGVVVPSSAADISTLLPLLAKTHTRFSIKSGGHAPLLSNAAENGVLVSLSKLRDYELQKETGVLKVGPGWRWGEVYKKLQEEGRTAVGGRYADVGVGGFLLGGGLSHLSNRYGFACDNVLAYEIVLASGDKLTADVSNAEDLFWALKGGGNNFGIVTAFHIQTHAQTAIWGGMHISTQEHMPACISAFDAFQQVGQQDPDAALIPTFCAGRDIPGIICYALVYYGAPKERPESLMGFWGVPAFMSTLRLATHAELCQELATNNSNTERHQFMVGTVRAKEGATKLLYDEFFRVLESFPGLASKCTTIGITPQPVSARMTRTNSPCGGKLDTASTWYIITAEYTDHEHDAEVTAFCHASKKAIHDAAEKAGIADGFLFLNDCGEGQDVMRSYGDETWAKMGRIATKYDPEGVFQKLVGGPKLSGVGGGGGEK